MHGLTIIEKKENIKDKKAVLLQGEPCDAFWYHWKSDEGLHTLYNNTGQRLQRNSHQKRFKYHFFIISI